MERKLKIILCIAVVILIAVISFVGVYIKDTVLFKNKVPDYNLSSDFGEKRITGFIFNTKETIYDKDGNKVDSIPEGANEADYRKEKENANSEEVLNTNNYKKVKEIFEGRLKTLNVEDYKIRMDENTGDITVELAENENTDKIIQYLSCTGDFSLKDAENGEVLLDRNNVKVAKVLYSNASSDGVTVYLGIQFDKEGKEKLAEISRKYVKPEETEKEEGENSEETTNEGENNEEKKEEDDKKNKVALTLEGSEMLTTHFGEEIKSGELTISLGTGKDNDSIQEYMEQGNFYAMLINNPEMPIKYKVGATETVKGNLNGDEIYISIGVLAIICLASVIYTICRFKINGVFGGISIILMIALLLLCGKYTNSDISLNSVFAVILLVALDTYLLSKILGSIKKDNSIENVHKATLKTYFAEKEIILITLVIAIVFTFMKHVGSYTFGMTVFYGVISIAISNLVFLRTILLAKTK